MLNKILRISLSNRAITLIISGLLLIWGCLTMLRTDVDIFPDLNAPTVVVMTEAPGMAPEEVEKQLHSLLKRRLTELPESDGCALRHLQDSQSYGWSLTGIPMSTNAARL